MARGVVLGGSSGIGRALVCLLTDERDDVTVISRGAGADVHPARSVSADIRDYESLAGALRAVLDGPPLDYVVNCVGVGFHAPIGANHADTWNDILATNVTGLLNLLSAIDVLCPELRHLLHVSSMAAHRPSSTPGNTCYAAAKTAASSIIAEYRHGLRSTDRPTRVSVVSPGVVTGTGFTAGYYARDAHQADPPSRLDPGPGLHVGEVAGVLHQVLRMPDRLEVIDLLVNLRGRP